MSSSAQLMTISAVTFTVTAATLYMVYKTTLGKDNKQHGTRRRKKGKQPGLWDGQAIWGQMRRTLVVRSGEECEEAVMKLRQATENVKVLGLDCEWCSTSGKPKPVALLQLAAANGLCVLIQLCHMERVPQSLKDLLADRSILKVGVGALDDANKLIKDYQILTTGCVDLRYIAVRHVSRDLRPQCYGAGLSRLADILIGVTLEKSYRIRCSNWEAYHMSWQQMKYAIHDAFVAVAIFFEILQPKMTFDGQDLNSIQWSSVLPLCQGIVDVKFKPKNMPQGSPNHTGKSKPGPSSKNFSRAYKARQTIMYHNCKLLAPDGVILCTCDKKKAEWYIHKDIGVVVSEEPFTVQLKFQPKGRPGPDRDYYLMEKQNRCVVCGTEESYIKKHIVPHEYKRFFPEYLKNHSSHDVLLLCLPCHQSSWSYDMTMRHKLVQEYDAPITSINSPMISDTQRSQVRSHAKGLLRHKKTKALPAERVAELEDTIKEFYMVEEVTQELLEEASQIHTRKPNKDYTGSHGEKVVKGIMDQEGFEGIIKFERRWREHFLKFLQPKFLPELWSVDHVHESVIGRLKDVENGLVLDGAGAAAAANQV